MSVLLRQQGLTGAVRALVDPVNGVRTGAAGLKDAAAGEPMQAGHRVHIGSLTKTVLALGVLRLEHGRRPAGPRDRGGDGRALRHLAGPRAPAAAVFA